MLKEIMDKNFMFYISIFIFGLALKLIPHPANFTPLLAIGLIAGLKFKKNYVAFLLPLMTTVVADIFLGFYQGFEFVYLGLVFCVLIGSINISGYAEGVVKFFGSTFGFYLISNFGVWLNGQMYSMDLAGLLKCYTLALPFYKTTLLSTFIFLIFFSCVELIICSQSSWSGLEDYGRQKR